MLKIRLAVASLGLAMISSAILQAQTDVAPAAPLPSQILTAKKIFISNVGTEGSYTWSGGPDRPYNEFYAAIKSWGRYELVGAPTDADMVLEISFADPITGVSGSKESGCDSSNTPQLKLVLRDPKTQIVLWTMRKDTRYMSGLQKTRDKKFNDAINSLVGDLKALIAQPVPAAK